MRRMMPSAVIAIFLATGFSLLPAAASAEPVPSTKKGSWVLVCFIIGKGSGQDKARARERRGPSMRGDAVRMQRTSDCD